MTAKPGPGLGPAAMEEGGPVLRVGWGRVSAVRRETGRLQELEVAVGGTRRRALAYVDLVGRVRPGDRVWLNTTAVDLQLGTGGYDFVIMAWGRRPPSGRGHFLKLRYTPLQLRFDAVEAQLSPLPR